MNDPEVHLNPDAPRKFLQGLKADDLDDIMERARKSSIGSGQVEGENSADLAAYQLGELMNDYPEIGQYIYDMAIRTHEAAGDDRDEQLIATGVALGATIMARAITIAAETQEIRDIS